VPLCHFFFLSFFLSADFFVSCSASLCFALIGWAMGHYAMMTVVYLSSCPLCRPMPDSKSLHGPGLQHDQTQISVDDIRKWLTNQIVEAPLHWRHEPTSVHRDSRWHLMWKASSLFMSATKRVYVSVLCTLEQNRPCRCLVQLYFGADTERTAIPYTL